MRRFATRFLLLPTGWLALAYLGFWLACCFDQVLIPLAAAPLASERMSDWQISSFLISLRFTHSHSHPNLHAMLRAGTLLLEVSFLVILLVKGDQLRSAAVRAWLHFTGLWVLFLMAFGLVQWLAAGRGDIGQVIRLFGSTGMLPNWIRLSVALPIVLFLLSAGLVCARRLTADLRATWSATSEKRWLLPIALAAPIEVIVWGASGFQWRWLARQDLPILAVPGLAALLLGVLGPSRGQNTPVRGGISTKAAAGAGLSAALLAASAIMALPVKSWLAERGLERFSSAHYEIRYPSASFTGASIQAFSAERESILNSAAARLETSLNSVHLKIILYADFPSERRATQSHLPYRVVGTTIRAALTGYIYELDPAADAAALLNATWGKPASPLVGDWIARWLAGEWRGCSVEAWAAQMESEVGHHTIRELYEGVPDGELSPDVNQMLGAAWIGWAYSRGGLAAVRKLYEGPTGPLGYEKAPAALGLAPNELETGWSEWLAKLASNYPRPAIADHTLPENFFFRGISFEDALSLDGAYSSPAAGAQIRTLHEMSANAIALVPYGFVDNANGGTVSYTRTGETDEGVSQSAYVAHQLGMKVMLKPQLWVRWGQFTGQIHFDGEAARKRWMRSYREFILHYARLAELDQIDLLCIGNELEGVTGDEAAWRALIADIRRVYHGPLTYAANWDKEFSSVHFWDALDYAGLNNYYPLAAKPSAQADALREGADALAAKLNAFHTQWHKPILFTEVGYPSVRGAAVEPWVEDAGRATNSDEQAAAYEAVFREFPARPWFAGMFWWKWRSDGSGGGPEDGSYSPIGKPAAEIIRNRYTRIASSPPKRQ